MEKFLINSVFFGAVISLVAYEAGLLLKKKFKLAILNPLLLAVLCVMKKEEKQSAYGSAGGSGY